MRLALLGVDDETLDLLEWAVTQGGHTLVVATDVASRTGEVLAIAPAVRLEDNWESLLLESSFDAVVVARGGGGPADSTGIAHADQRADQLRKLAQERIPLLVICPACEAIVGYEIEMIRRDVHGVIVPYLPGGDRAVIAQFRSLVEEDPLSPIGRVEQVQLERQQLDRSRPEVLVQLVRDAAILRQLIGPLRSVSASGPPTRGRDPLGPRPKEPPSLSNLSVHFGGDGELAARWSIGPVVKQAGGTLTLLGAEGRAMLHMPDRGAWSIELPASEGTPAAYLEENPFSPAISRLRQAIEGADADPQAWLSTCRDQEAAEAVDRSLLRGRTIELFNEAHTEEAAFKGIMSMGGCLLLLVALGTIMVAALVEGLQLPLRNWPAWRLWPVFLLAPVVVFLLLQVLKAVVKPDENALAVHDQRPA